MRRLLSSPPTTIRHDSGLYTVSLRTSQRISWALRHNYSRIGTKMQGLNFAELKNVLSPDRLWGYQTNNTTASDEEVTALYLWNISLCEAFYPVLNCLEIALRNSLHNAISTKYGTPLWFSMQPPVLKQREQAEISVATAKLPAHRKPPSQPLLPGRIIAELPFGFWGALFHRTYVQVFWPDLLRPVFPYMPPRGRTPKELFLRISDILKLRNRIFHYEPIWRDQALQRYHYQLIKTISWISPTLRDTVFSMDRFTEVLRLGPTHYRLMLEEYLHTKQAGTTTN